MSFFGPGGFLVGFGFIDLLVTIALSGAIQLLWRWGLGAGLGVGVFLLPRVATVFLWFSVAGAAWFLAMSYYIPCTTQFTSGAPGLSMLWDIVLRVFGLW